MNMIMSIADLPKPRREEITVLEILRRNFRDQGSAKKGSKVVLEIPLGDVNMRDNENVSPIIFCRIVRSFKSAGITIEEFDRYDVEQEAHQSDYPEAVTFCAVTVSPNFDSVCERLLTQAWGGTQESTEKISLGSNEVLFSEKKAQLQIGNRTSQLPPHKNEHDLCRIMFKHEKGTPVDWSDIHQQMTGSRDAIGDRADMNAVRDAMYAVNNRIQRDIPTGDKLFQWNNKTISRNF